MAERTSLILWVGLEGKASTTFKVQSRKTLNGLQLKIKLN